MEGVSVVLTTFPERRDMLRRAFDSVLAQTLQPEAVIVANDVDRAGAAANRDAGLHSVGSEWVAFLDDDDEMLPHHLLLLMLYAQETDACLVYPWFTVVGGTDPFPHLYRKPYSPDTQTTVTFLARTECVRRVGGFGRDWDETVGTDPGVDPSGNRAGEEYRLVRRMHDDGCRIEHFPQRTWLWHHHGQNTMGLPSRRPAQG